MAIKQLTNCNWTVFYDKHSHGFKKTQYEAIFVNKAYDDALIKLKEALSLSNKTLSNSLSKNYSYYSGHSLYQVSKYFFEKENKYYGTCSLENFFSSNKYLFICDTEVDGLILEYNYSKGFFKEDEDSIAL